VVGDLLRDFEFAAVL
jgi:hypothetical protein